MVLNKFKCVRVRKNLSSIGQVYCLKLSWMCVSWTRVRTCALCATCLFSNILIDSCMSWKFALWPRVRTCAAYRQELLRGVKKLRSPFMEVIFIKLFYEHKISRSIHFRVITKLYHNPGTRKSPIQNYHLSQNIFSDYLKSIYM